MAIEHPFQALFETFGRLPAVHAESVNRLAYQQLWDLLAVSPEQPGRCILLRSPRAGHGKTHLLSRLQHHLGAGHEFIPLHAANGSQIDAGTVTGDTLARLGRSLPAGGGLTVLDLLVRRLFSLALQPLVSSGEVPCQDREGALAALRNRPVETFDFQHPNAVTAHWAKENFEVLGPRLALELTQRSGAPLRDVMFWVDALFRFAATPVDLPTRTGTLIQSVASSDLSAAQVFDRLAALLGLLSQLVRIVLVADDLEGFSSDESAALRLAAFLGSLRHAAERIDAIVSVNRDIWESAFVPRLSAGLADRLAEVVVELEPLQREDIVALLDARAPGLGERVYDRIEVTNGERHARGILRAAGDAWTQAARQARPAGTEPQATPSAVPVAEAPASKIESEPADDAVPEPATHVATVAPQAAIAMAVAAAAAAMPEDESVHESSAPSESAHVVPEGTDPHSPAFAPVAQAMESAEEPTTFVWNFPNATLPSEPAIAKVESFSHAVVAEEVIPEIAPVLPEPESVVAPVVQPVVPAVAHPAYIPTAAILHETPLSEVLASEAAAEATPTAWPPVHVPPFSGGATSPFQIPTGPESIAVAALESSPSAIVNPTASLAPAPPVAPVAPVEVAAPPAVAVASEVSAHTAHAPVYGSASPSGASMPPPVPTSHAQPSTPAAPETDRVDELLRQFRERYARG